MVTSEPLARLRGQADHPERYSGGGAELAAVLAQAARSLDAASGTDETLQAVVRAAAQVIPGVDSVGITHARPEERVVDVRYASDQLVIDLDGAQHSTGQGPGLDAASLGHTVLVDDFAGEQRWPQFSARARDLGAGSLLSLPLYMQAKSIAALNLYSRRAGAFDEDSQQIALLFATHAGICLARARQVQELHRALHTRDMIGQAKGILMHQYGIDADQAFQVLVKASTTTNTKLREIAERLAQAGEMAPEATRS